MKDKIQENKRVRFCFVILFSVFYFLFSNSSVFAAEFFFKTQTNEWRVDDQFVTEFFLNTKGDDINAIEGRISYPKEFLELKEIRDGDSIVNFWIERPRVGNGEVVFSGITPGGYQGENGLLFSLVFRTVQEGQGVIEIRDIMALKNDGKGTAAEARASNLSFLISEEVPEVQLPEIKDTESPESFVPKIAKDEGLFEGKWFVVFATQDKISGIDYYKIKESRQRLLMFLSRWKVAESPYVLQDQDLRSHVVIKAVDRSGNERIVRVSPRYPLAWYTNYENWAIIIIIGFAIAYAMRRFLWRKYVK